MISNSFNDYFDDLNYIVSAIEALIFASDGQISLDSIYDTFNLGIKNSNKQDKRYNKTNVNEEKKYKGKSAIDRKKKKEMILKAIDFIKNEFNNNSKHGIYLSINNNNFSFKTKPEYYEIISELLKVKPQKFTKPQLETLSIIAYRQPIIKSEIDNIRGVDTGGIIKFLLEKNLIKTAGRKDILGRPLIYKTTDRFLEVFNLKALDELPKVEEIRGIVENRDNIQSSPEELNELELPF